MAADPLPIAPHDWALALAARERTYPTDDHRMALAIALAAENVARGTGGPFGAAVFDEETGEVLGVGVNSVERLHNCALHAEVLALMTAQQQLGTHTFARGDRRRHVLATSCDPCAMCLGAIHWSGIRRVLCGATREDALSIGFDEGPVFAESIEYLAARGVEFVHGLRRAEARAVLERYRDAGGLVYNANG